MDKEEAITLSQIKTETRILKQKILKAIGVYEAKTGLVVSDIHLVRLVNYTYGKADDSPHTIKVGISTEVPTPDGH